MYCTFNCGIGFIISIEPRAAKKIIARIKDTDIIGEVVAGSKKLKIESMFSSQGVVFKNYKPLFL